MKVKQKWIGNDREGRPVVANIDTTPGIAIRSVFTMSYRNLKVFVVNSSTECVISESDLLAVLQQFNYRKQRTKRQKYVHLVPILSEVPRK